MIRASMLLLSLATVGGPGSAATWAPVASDMIRTGACGSGSAVVGDGCAPVLYAGQPQLDAYGQGLAGGWNSQDTDAVEWRIGGLGDALGLRLTLMDLHDQRGSFARVTVGGAEWAFDRGDNANVRVIDLGLPGGDAILVRIETRRNDGFSALAEVCRPEAG